MRSRWGLWTALLLLAFFSTACSLPRAAAEAAPASTGVVEEADPVLPVASLVPVEIVTPGSSETGMSKPVQTSASFPELPPETPEVPPTLSPDVHIGPCEQEVCIVPFQFPFARPILPPGRDTIDPSYRFGTTAGGERDPHHGVEFLNSKGTPVLAAAAGEVVVAGDDLSVKLGLYPNMYGNLVVLKHVVPGMDEPVLTLYAHLSKIDVQVGDQVEAGQKLGEVGGTGAALGSHLHLEVRYAEDTYAASRNPELWLQPLPDNSGQPMGVLAGRILDEQGKLVQVENIVVASPSGLTFYIGTYAETALVGMEPWQESFAVGDILAGEYKISFIQGGMHERTVEVRPGQLTLVTFRLGE